MAKFFLVLSLLAAGAAAGLGYLTYQKIIEQRGTLKTTQHNLADTKSELAATKITLKTAQDDRDSFHTQLDAKTAEAQKLTDQVNDLNGKLTAAQGQVTDLTGKLTDANKTIEDLKKLIPTTPGQPASTEGVGGIISDLKRQIDELKLTNDTLTKKADEAEKQVAALTKANQIREANLIKKGVEGIVMAVNPGYGFAVVSLGDHQGSAPNAELIVERNGQQIAKLKVTTVEPALSVADIIPDSLAKGQRVLPGDKVIFTGNLVQP